MAKNMVPGTSIKSDPGIPIDWLGWPTEMGSTDINRLRKRHDYSVLACPLEPASPDARGYLLWAAWMGIAMRVGFVVKKHGTIWLFDYQSMCDSYYSYSFPLIIICIYIYLSLCIYLYACVCMYITLISIYIQFLIIHKKQNNSA